MINQSGREPKMFGNTHTLNIVDLLGQFPIFSTLIENLDFWDLIQLSRTSTAIRYLCHGFATGDSDEPKYIPGSNIRSFLRIGEHKTTRWRLHKSLASRHCREVNHTRGAEPFGCKLCSKPVCLACIVKHSFGKQENTFALRSRPLCQDCFKDGNPNTEHISVEGSTIVAIPYFMAGLCVCTAQEGILCLDCKVKQNEESMYQFKDACAGAGCGRILKDPFASARICLWCNSLLPNAGQRKHYNDESSGLAELQGALLLQQAIGPGDKQSKFKWFPKPVFDRAIRRQATV